MSNCKKEEKALIQLLKNYMDSIETNEEEKAFEIKLILEKAEDEGRKVLSDELGKVHVNQNREAIHDRQVFLDKLQEGLNKLQDMHNQHYAYHTPNVEPKYILKNFRSKDENQDNHIIYSIDR